MNSRIEETIKALWLDEEAKNSLILADRMLNSPNEAVRNSMYTPVVVSGEGCGFSSYGRAFSAIVDASLFLSVRGSSTFLELDFPKGNKSDEDSFFYSPKKAASTQNRFYGTLLINLGKFQGKDLIIGEEAEFNRDSTYCDTFYRLLEFVENNRKNIRFLFRITPDFKEREELVKALQELSYVNAEVIFLNKPDLEKSCSYVISKLKELRLKADDKAVRCIREEIVPELIRRESFRGFHTLNAFVKRLALEAAIASNNGEYTVDPALLKGILPKVRAAKEANPKESRRIGFGSGRR